MELLDMQWILNRVLAMSGAADMPGDTDDDDDDDNISDELFLEQEGDFRYDRCLQFWRRTQVAANKDSSHIFPSIFIISLGTTTKVNAVAADPRLSDSARNDEHFGSAPFRY